MYFYFFCYR